jgi:hypothetical protein
VLSNLGAGALSLTEPHNEFLELCAFSASSQLTEEEQKRLQEHLAVCESCRQALQQYETVVRRVIPAMAARETSESLEANPDWSEEEAEKAEKAFFNRLSEEACAGSEFKGSHHDSADTHRLGPFSSQSTWRHVWMLYASGILLFVSLSFYAYRAGMRRGTDIVTVAPASAGTQVPSALEAQLSDAGHERQLAREDIERRDKTIAELRQQLAQQSIEISRMKAAQDRLEGDLHASDANGHDLAQQRTELAKTLDAAQSSSQALQQKLESLARQSAQDAAGVKALDAKVNELNRLLHDREVALDQKDELLAHDRDIRELMGARDLYVAEVFDVARTGETQKPYGRVFYTRGKSLIFYAYDLDQQASVKKAAAFQAWGRRGPDQQQALSLGIFYEDNDSKKRWILKCDDPKTLAQIDAVFVTVEPDGGSHKPSGKSLLFAYLRVDPNHP